MPDVHSTMLDIDELVPYRSKVRSGEAARTDLLLQTFSLPRGEGDDSVDVDEVFFALVGHLTNLGIEVHSAADGPEASTHDLVATRLSEDILTRMSTRARRRGFGRSQLDSIQPIRTALVERQMLVTRNSPLSIKSIAQMTALGTAHVAAFETLGMTGYIVANALGVFVYFLGDGFRAAGSDIRNELSTEVYMVLMGGYAHTRSAAGRAGRWIMRRPR